LCWSRREIHPEWVAAVPSYFQIIHPRAVQAAEHSQTTTPQLVVAESGYYRTTTRPPVVVVVAAAVAAVEVDRREMYRSASLSSVSSRREIPSAVVAGNYRTHQSLLVLFRTLHYQSKKKAMRSANYAYNI